MAIAARVNTVAEGETPIASYKYNEEMNNVYTVLNSIASFFASGTPPSSPGAGQYWLDTSVSPSVLRQFDGTVWRWTGFFFGASAPSNPAAGAFFINSVSGTMAYWSGTEWVGLPATAISYDGTESGLLAENVQDAIDEISVDYEAAATAVTQAQGYASAASASAAGAAGSAGLAGDYALAASGSATDAEEFAEKAEAWSDGEGEVEPGRFSAKTWADAASGIVVPDNSVSNAKLVDMAAGTLKGRNSEGIGDPEDLSIATVRGMLGTATTEAAGLLSAADKTKLDGLESGVGPSDVIALIIALS